MSSLPPIGVGQKPIRFLIQHWEAAENYLWKEEEGCYNVVAIFGTAQECAEAAKALNSSNAYKAADPDLADRK